MSHSDSTSLGNPGAQLKGCVAGSGWTLLFTPQNCGCSSVVEHLLAKEDVASSSLVTRSRLRLQRSGKAETGACAQKL